MKNLFHTQEELRNAPYRIECYFIVDTFGKIREPIILTSNKNYKDKIIALFKDMPPWIPAEKFGKKVPTSFTMPILSSWE